MARPLLHITFTKKSRRRCCCCFRLNLYTLYYVLRCEKTGLRGFRPGPTQAGLTVT